MDRRRIKRRIAKLEGELRDLGRTRKLQRKSRGRSGLQNVSIVGYTNAGKSTLLNCLTDAGVLVEDRLFATLDPTTRRLALPGGEPVLLTDTVGFVRRLPHGLVEAFKSTLETVAEADLLVHVVDASAPDPQAQIDAVRTVLAEIDAQRVPELLVFNKADLAGEEATRLAKLHPGSVAVSARTGAGVELLLQAIGDRLRALANVVELVIPYERGDVLAAVHREGEVVSTAHDRRRRAGAGPPRRGRRRPARRVRRRLSADHSRRAGVRVQADSHDHERSPGLRPPALPVRPSRRLQAGRRGARRRCRRPVDRHPVRPAPGRRAARRWPDRTASGAIRRSIGTAELRSAAQRWIGRRFDVDVPPAQIGGVHRHEGVRRHAAAVAPPAHPRPRHRALPGGGLPHLRDGRHPRRLPGRAGARSARPAGSTSAPSTPPTPTGPCASG